MVDAELWVGNDDIEVVCDLLWYAKRESGLSPVAEGLRNRLQPIRHGDYAGGSETYLTAEHARAVVDVARLVEQLDEDEARVVLLCRSLLG